MNNVLRRSILLLGGVFLVLALAIFLPGGIGWWEGWFFLAVFTLETIFASLYLWRRNPEIFAARSKLQSGIKPWDKVMMILLIVSIMTIFPVAGATHSAVPPWVIVVGYILLTIGMVGSVWVYGVNKFAEPGVRIQTDRGHKVVDTGPYAIVRHPLYATAFLIFGGFALPLGSYWALIPAAIAAMVLVVRTALEDRTLQRELEGYKDYAGRVRSRLIPGVW
jgi:protein-S-isoprenylcysteine O-methyltransferase Ste14